jgi:aspartate/methionine/tyrosine aminotransferase
MQPSILQQKTAKRSRMFAAPTPPGPTLATGNTSTAVREAAAEAVGRHLCDHYTRRPGIAPLCQAVASHLTALGVNMHENDVVVSGSVEEARYVALRSLAVGKTVYLFVPATEPYAAGLNFAGAASVMLSEEEDLPNPSAGGPALLLIANPQPASAQWADAQMQRLAQWAADHDLPVIADETGAPRDGYTPFAALPGMAQRTLTLGGFAGAPGLAAWQVSWFGGTKPLLTPVRDLKQSITICTSAPSQYAALAALEELEGAKGNLAQGKKEQA